MKKEFINKRLQSYEEGLTSSAEEKELLSLLSNSEKGANAWFKYLKLHKSKAPENLENSIWMSIQSREKRNRKTAFLKLAAAASVVLAVSIFLVARPKHYIEMSYNEKAEMLESALSLIPDNQNNKTLTEILYEDENIIIYTK